MPNRLENETSPYLLQHADNPVDWYPWGEEALARARVEEKPIFLSIGYSACHWCHVMAHESFEDPATADLMNQHFVNIKVDREERPDLDQIYMSAVQAMTGQGGWPMSVFLTPQGDPFYGGTYFPPAPRYGMPSFRNVLLGVVEAWRSRRQELVSAGARLAGQIGREGLVESGEEVQPLHPQILKTAVEHMRQGFDRAQGGWGGAPKFPQPMALEFLLRRHHATRDPLLLQMVTQTLEAMARGGIYDQLGGGFHRYSVDARWLVPHFEKMLYDNAQLARVYLHAWQVTGEAFFRAIAVETLDYVAREMTDPAGGFYSAQDADSEGEEGKFFIWTPEEIRQALGQDAGAFLVAYRVTEAGNFEGKNILEYRDSLERRPALEKARQALYAVREKRVHPGRDEKVLTAWNGLMLAAFAEAAGVLGREKGSRELAATYLRIAERNAEFLLRELRRPDGRLLRTWKASPEQGEGAGEARLNAYLEDYTHLIEGLLELYQATFEPRWFVAARELAETMIAHFQAPGGGFYDTSDDHEALITRPRALQDNAVPSGNGMAVITLLKLAGFTNELRYVDLAHQALAQMQPMMAQYPLGFGQWLQALAYALSKPEEIAIVGDPDSVDTQALLGVVRDGYRPFQVVALGAPDAQLSAVPLLEDRGQLDGQATAYVCRDFACQAPVADPDGLCALLGRQEAGFRASDKL